MRTIQKSGITTGFILFFIGSGYFFSQTEQATHFLSYLAYPALSLNYYFTNPQSSCASSDTKRLERQITILQMQNVRLRAALSFAHNIKELHAFNERYEGRGIIAQVLARTLTADDHYFLIDAGANKDILKDMVVVSHNNLIGKVVEVFPWYSKVALITDRHCNVACYCDQTHAHGIAQGENKGDELTLKYVDHVATIVDGDIVFSSGQGLVFPAGFAVGTIKDHHQDGLYQTVTIEPLCNFNDIAYCLVLAR